MKSSILAIAFTISSLVPFAQKKKDYIVMKSNGKMYRIRGGESIRMMISVPLKNGETVTNKGQITSLDGAAKQLTPGDTLMMDGTILKKAKTGNLGYKK